MTTATEAQGPAPAADAWPATLTKADYGRYRAHVFGRGSPQSICNAIARGKLGPPAVRPDGLIDRQAADRQLAAGADPDRPVPGVPGPAIAPPLPTGDAVVTGTTADDDDPAAAAPSYVAERVATERVRRRHLELDLAAKEGLLLDRAAVERERYTTARQVRDRLLGLPHRVAVRLVGLDERAIADELSKALSGELAELAADLEKGVDDDDDGDSPSV